MTRMAQDRPRQASWSVHDGQAFAEAFRKREAHAPNEKLLLALLEQGFWSANFDASVAPQTKTLKKRLLGRGKSAGGGRAEYVTRSQAKYKPPAGGIDDKSRADVYARVGATPPRPARRKIPADGKEVAPLRPVLTQPAAPALPPIDDGALKLTDFQPINERKCVGRGQFCRVYETARASDGKDVAIKLCKGIVAAGASGRGAEPDVQMAECFAREVELLRDERLRHANIVKYRGYGYIEQKQGRLGFIALELLCGEGDLRMLLLRRKIAVDSALKWAAQLASALSCLHVCGVVHRDVKPSNCMILGDGTLKLIDFGLAIRLEGGHAATTKYQSSQRLGVPGFMPPEVYRCEPYGAPVDVFAYGVVVHRMLWNAIPPGACESMRAWWRRMLQDVMPESCYASTCAPLAPDAWPEPLAELVTRCCASEPTARPPAPELVRLVAAASRRYVWK